MELPSPQGRRLFAAAVFVASTFVLALQFVNPSPIVVSVGENGGTTTELGGVFTYRDAVIVAVAGCSLGISGTYLLTQDPSPTPETSIATPEASTPRPGAAANGGTSPETPSEDLLEQRREEWTETADRLANNEAKIYETVLEADGVLAQSEIVERTDLSKATVSRSLDSLETKDLLERKRRGMGNMVLLL